MASKVLHSYAGVILICCSVILVLLAIVVGNNMVPGLCSQPPTTAHLVYQTQLTASQQAFHNKLEAILADDLDIQSGRDSITYFTEHHMKPWNDQETRDYAKITDNVTALFEIRDTLIAQYDSLSEAPDTKADREACLPKEIPPQEDISLEIAMINQYCA